MPITLDLPPELETRLRARASRRQMTPEEYLRTIAVDRLRPRVTTGMTLTPEERRVIGDLNAELSRDFWLRYYFLQQKARTDATSEERDEALELGARSEEWNTRRLTVVMEMTKKRSVTVTEFMRHNKIGHHPMARELSDRYRSS